MQLAPSALHDTAGTLGGYLGWTLNELIIDDIVSLDGPHERRIALRLNSDANNVQMWAIGGIQAADQEPAEGITPLPRGHHYNSWVHIGSLQPDEDPATVLYSAITERLMPVFDAKPLYVGHRPWEEAFDSALSEVMAESTPTEKTSLRDCGPEAHTRPHDTVQDGTTEVEPAEEPPTEPSEETAPEPENPADPAAKAFPTRPRRKPPAKTDISAADGKPVRPTRRRTPAKQAAAKADTPAASDKPARPARKQTPAKKAARKPTS
ncbi:hypothetical protein [Streptomyces sp. NPDC006668]|uniref:hypothetical protein n=1 Tax=Streptomyces sp. NPDC006668 TaxID=3156903 RepID=UPI0033CC0BFD